MICFNVSIGFERDLLITFVLEKYPWNESLFLVKHHAVCKINVGTDLGVAFTGEIRKVFFTQPKEYEIRKYTTPAREAVKEMVKDKMINVFESAGHAVMDK